MLKNKKKIFFGVFTIFMLLTLLGCGGGGDSGGGSNQDCGPAPESDNPAIWFTYVPPFGSFNNIKGRVSHLSSENYNVAVYIYVYGGWWTKPYWARPVTDIGCGGNFITDITTGGVDSRATEIRAYLIPEGYIPPKAYGGSLPQDVVDNSVAAAIAKR